MEMVGVGFVEVFIVSILAVVPFILLFFVIKWAVAGAMREAVASESRSAREILDERYAKGEIGREEYERMRRDIEG